MPTPAIIVSGVAVKVRQCGCGLAVFEADARDPKQGRAVFDVIPAEVMEMVNGKDAIFWQPRVAPSFARHICPIIVDE